MTVESTGNIFSGITDVNSLIKMIGEKKMADNIFGGSDGSGLIGGLILGSLLRNNGNLFGGDGAGGVRPATPNDVQNTVGFINTVQDINAARRDVFQSQGNVQSQIAQAVQTETVQNLQGQIALLTAINNSTQMTGNAVDTVNASISSHSDTINGNINVLGTNINTRMADLSLGVASGFSGVNQNMSVGFAGINQNISSTAYQTAATIRDDGDKTRAAIQALSDKISAQELADLQRQLSVAQGALLDQQSDNRQAQRARDVEVNVSQNMTNQQNQVSIQNQLNGLANAVAILAQNMRNTQDVINLGTMAGTTQTAANTRVNG